MRLGAVIEGKGEVEALPLLVRRMSDWLPLARPVQHVERPFRVPWSRLVRRPDALERAVRHLRTRVDATLVLIDSDDELACQLGPALLERCRAAVTDHPVGVVLAEREFESWFLAGAESLAGVQSLSDSLAAPANHAQVRDAKGWLSERMGSRGPYSPVVHQARLAARVDLELVRERAPSFDKLCRTLLDLSDRCTATPLEP